MLKGLYTAYTGLNNEQSRMEVITNNLANVNTTGYKKTGATSQAFADVLVTRIKDYSEVPPIPKRLGYGNPGVKIGEGYTDYTQGAIKSTDNPLDVAISGAGFFAVEYTNREGETSTKYTRDGSFTVNREGDLVTHDGDFVLNTNGGHIRLDPLKKTVIDLAGRVSQDGTEVASLQVTDFEDYDYLENFGENMVQPVDGATEQDTEVQLHSGFLEGSNVSAVSEMVEMINVSRAFESNQKIIQIYDETLNIAANQIAKI